jgi:hypothetical protein
MYNMENITCNELWREWMLSDPNNHLVVAAKQKISTYSKDDWTTMSAEATYLTEKLGELVKYDIPIESKLAESGFDDLVEHFHKWFFPITKLYIFRLSRLCKTDYKYAQFFNNFYPGLADYLYRLVPIYVYKVS